LKRLALYLCSTIDWGIPYWRSTPAMSLPNIPIVQPTYDTQLHAFPQATDPFKLTGYVDAAHANDLCNRCSTTGYGFFLAGGTIAYRCKTQSITATSLTEAEIIAAVSAAKVARYFRMIMKELGFQQHKATILYEDNQSTIHMVNSGKPTEQSRHINIQYFAIQDWKRNGNIQLCHIPGIINSADVLTKPLS
jgi:hypothetical protein